MTKTAPKPQLVKKEVLFELTESEFAERSKIMASLDEQIHQLEREAENMKKRFKAEIELLSGQRRHVSKIVKAGQEIRVVDCTEVQDVEKYLVNYWYRGKLVEQRAMTPDERQLELLPTAGVVHSQADDNHTEAQENAL